MRLLVCFFFFKQKTAYEMRISDWSSDVCSSDLDARLDAHNGWRCDAGGRGSQRSGDDARQEHLPDPGVGHLPLYARRRRQTDRPDDAQRYDLHEPAQQGLDFDKSAERSVGKECVSTCRARWSPVESKKKNINIE